MLKLNIKKTHQMMKYTFQLFFAIVLLIFVGQQKSFGQHFSNSEIKNPHPITHQEKETTTAATSKQKNGDGKHKSNSKEEVNAIYKNVIQKNNSLSSNEELKKIAAGSESFSSFIQNLKNAEIDPAIILEFKKAYYEQTSSN
jgi:hypothetical protein